MDAALYLFFWMIYCQLGLVLPAQCQWYHLCCSTSNLLQCLSVVADMSWHISSWTASALTDFSGSWQLRARLTGYGCAKQLRDRLSTWLHTFNPAASFIQHSVGLSAVTQHSCALLPPLQPFSFAICHSSCSSPAHLQSVCYLVFCNTIYLHSRSCLAHLCWHALFDRGSRVDMHDLLGAAKLTCKIC